MTLILSNVIIYKKRVVKARKVLRNGMSFANERFFACGAFARPLFLIALLRPFNIGLSFTGDFFMVNILTSAFDFAKIFSNVLSNWYYYVGFALVVIMLLLFCTLKKQPARANLSSTQKLVYVSLFSALATVSNVFDISVSSELQISLLATVGFITGYLFGGGTGFAVCFIGDLLGALINPHGVYNPIIAIGSGLWGFIPGVIYSFFKGNDYVKLAISYLLCFAVISGGVNTLGIYLMYGLGKHTFAYYFASLPWKLIGVAANAIICAALLSALPKILPKNHFTFTDKEDKN